MSDSEQYGSHSLRLGFSGWVNTISGWDVKTLIPYVGWPDVQSALRYIDDCLASITFAGDDN